MRKIYFIIFGVVLLVLILLVDWREKFQQLTHSQPGERLGQILSSPHENPAANGANLSGEAVANEVLPEPPYEDPAAAALMPAPDAVPTAGDPGFSDMPAPPLALPRPFQDLPELPYLDDSRRVLRNTIANYDRISPPASPAPHPQRRP